MGKLNDLLNKSKFEIGEQIEYLENIIGFMIEEKRRDIEEIETILDVILEYTLIGVGATSFLKLNKYYEKIMPDNAKTYRIWFSNYCGMETRNPYP